MGSALNELSDFAHIALEEELIKCGEIVVATKQNKYLFSCTQCSGIFPQMAIFVRHLQWEHQGDVLGCDQQREHEISIYTVEELLNNEDGSKLDEDVVTEGGIRKTVSDEDDDTGIDSDVELENEIKKLLTSMADSLSDDGTEYTAYDSGVESKNNTNQKQNISNREDNKQCKENQEEEDEMELRDSYSNLGTNTVESQSGRSVESENDSGFDSRNASKEKYDCINLKQQIPLKECEINVCASPHNKIQKKYVKKVLKHIKKSASNNEHEVHPKTTLESNIDAELFLENSEHQFENESVKSNNDWVAIDMEMHDLTHEGSLEELDSVLSTDEMQCVRAHSEEAPLNSMKLLGSNGPTNANVLPSHISIPLDECDTPYLDFNESKLQITESRETALAQAVSGEVPLDLSFDKSTQLTDAQTGDISEVVNATAYGKAATMFNTEQADKLLDHQATSADNPIFSIESNILHSSDSIEGHQLPPFSKFFKNTANISRSINGFLAQSTPKQKHAITGSPLRPSAKLNIKANGTSQSAQKHSENIENGASSSENNDISYMKRKCNILKRVAGTMEKENKTKKIKTLSENTKENIKAKVPTRIEILNVDIIVPDGRTLKAENTLVNSNAATVEDKSKIEENSKFPVEKQEVTETNKYVSKCQVAADTTSESHTTSCTEINYTPEDTLNQLKLEAIADNSITKNSLNNTALWKYNVNQSLIDGTSLLDDSLPSTASEEDKENYVLLRTLGLKIITDANAEDGLQLGHLEAMREKASAFANIYADFKYLWKVGKGSKSYEQLEIDINKLMHRLNEHFKFELTITQTKRIVNLISMWFMQSYHMWLIEKKPALSANYHYLNLFRYLPKTSRRIYYCEDCPRYFLAQTKYSSHRKRHMATTPSCAYCQTIFTSRSAQLQHAKVCTTFKCIECGRKFENAASLEHHLRQKHLLQCDECGQLCANAIDLEWHEHQYPIICGLCNQFFYSGAELQKHRQDSFHWDYTCRTCEVFLPTATQMKQHLSLCSHN